MHVVQWRCRQIGSARLWFGLRRRTRRRDRWRRRARRCAHRRRTRRGHWGPVQSLQWSLQRRSMGIDAIGHQSAIGRRDSRTCRTRRSSSWAIGSTGISVGRADAIGGLGRLCGLRRVGMTTKARTLEEVLLLSRSILCTNLLTIDTLHGETLECRTPETGLVC